MIESITPIAAIRSSGGGAATENPSTEYKSAAPRKWNSILQPEDDSRLGNPDDIPLIQPNQRIRSESVPEIRTNLVVTCQEEGGDSLTGSLLLSPLNPPDSGTTILSKMMDISMKWDKSAESMRSSLSPLSPLRSPVVADWKAVGSPIATASQSNDSLFDDADTLSLSEERYSSKTIVPCKNQRLRRQRAMSLIERLPSVLADDGGADSKDSIDIELEKYRRVTRAASISLEGSSSQDGEEKTTEQTTGRGNNSHEPSTLIEDPSNTIVEPPSPRHSSSPQPIKKFPSQVAQIPRALHEVLGVETAEEVSELFKRTSMDCLLPLAKKGDQMVDKERQPSKPLSAMPSSLFGRTSSLGPAAMLFSNDAHNNNNNIANNGHGKDDSGQGDTMEWRPSKEEEAMDADEDASTLTNNNDSLLSKRQSSLFDYYNDWKDSRSENAFSIDDYFSPNPSQNPSTLFSSRFQSRRHSIASTGLFPEVEDRFGSLSLSVAANESVHELDPFAESFDFKGYGPRSSAAFLDFMSMTNGSGANVSDCNLHGKMSALPVSSLRDVSFQLSTYKGPLYAVEFKAGRTEIFYVLEIDGNPQMHVKVGDLVIVEADRGEDLGKVTIEISVDRLKQLMMPGSSASGNDKDSDILTPELAALVHSKEIVPKRIHRLAQSGDLKLLQAKAQEEAIAMVRCQSRIRQKKLPMEVVDAEYQWDRNKLTFYFCADRRIDFRELVRDLFRIYKTRIWMCAVDKGSPRMLMYSSPCGSSVTSISAHGSPTVTELGDFFPPGSFS